MLAKRWIAGGRFSLFGDIRSEDQRGRGGWNQIFQSKP